MKVVAVIAVHLLFVAVGVRQVNGRQAVRPADDLSVTTEAAAIGGAAAAACSIDINKDLAEPQPLFLVPNTSEYWLPESNGRMKIPSGAAIELYCTRSFSNASWSSASSQRGRRQIFPICVGDTTFLLNDEKFQLKQFTCSAQIRYVVERMDKQCSEDGANLFRVGFNVSAGRFVDTMEICHDESQLKTLYVHHKLTPANVHFQKYVKRLNFSKAGYFGKRNMNYLYSQNNQAKVLRELLDGHYHERFFNNKSLFLSRGHLSAKTDQIFGPQQRSTFNFLNVAPQWQSFNGGTWNSVEDDVRKLVAKWKINVDCYTGTWGVLTLPLAGSTGEHRNFYLTRDENNNGLIPVPRLFYRVIIDSKNPKRGIAIIGVNNPHVTLDEISRDYSICNDISESVPWIRWRRNNIVKGYFYACQVDEFAHAVQHLPKHLQNVTELLLSPT